MRAAIEELLAKRDFAAFVGQIENQWFDAKDQPYKIDSDSGKRELAKDIAAFANSQGGVVVIGLRTEKSATQYRDEVIEIRPFASSLVDSGRYRDVLTAWIYPPVEDVEAEWLASIDDSAKGRVPEQRESLKPFLVMRALDGGKIVETLFGYSERRQDLNAPSGIVELQRALRIGLNFERVLDERLSAIEAVLRNPPIPSIDFAYTDQQAPPPMKLTSAANLYEERINRTLTESDFSDERSLAVAARPIPASELRTIFTAGEGSIREKFENPPALRSAGWDLSTRGYAEIIRGQMLRSPGFRKTLDLYRDGTLIFACDASDGFLAWTSPDQKLHPLGLIEVFYNFCMFFDLVIRDLRVPPSEVEFAVALRHLHKDNVKTRLGPGVMNSFAQMMPEWQRAAPDDTAIIKVPLDATSYKPEIVAFDVVRELYLWFGIMDDKIPYTRVESDRRTVDADLIRAS